MVFFQLAFQSQLQFGNLLAEKPFGQLGHFLWGCFSFDQSSQHQPAGHSEHVRGHVGQLDVGGLQYFQETVALRRLTFHQLTTIAHQVAEFADGLRRNEAGTKLERSSPWQSKSAIHSASFTSVLRPGTFLMCCALATTISKAPSRMA